MRGGGIRGGGGGGRWGGGYVLGEVLEGGGRGWGILGV
jgi:hypothetical protein